jgi:uncharacterized small protein (TIGR04563 family)
MNNLRSLSVYFPAEMLEEIEREAKRLDRSLSWMVQHAWALAHPRMTAYAPTIERPKREHANANVVAAAHEPDDEMGDSLSAQKPMEPLRSSVAALRATSAT